MYNVTLQLSHQIWHHNMPEPYDPYLGGGAHAPENFFTCVIFTLQLL